MGFVGGLLGVNGGVNGTGISGPQSASIQAPTTDAQIKGSFDTAQLGLTNQQDFLRQVQAQNGLQNQSNVYNQLQSIVNGTGPNPALAQLANATGANAANQASMMAAQRGASSNPGLIARQAAQQGANIQQQAAGQGAALQAQQQLNAINASGNLATNQANQQAGATNAFAQSGQGEQANLLNAVSGQNNARVGNQSNINNVNGALVGQTMGMQGQLMGNIAGGAGAAMSLAQGGMVPGYADGGIAVTTPGPGASITPSANPSAPRSRVANFMSNPQAIQSPQASVGTAGNVIGSAIGQGIKSLFSSSPSDDMAQKYADADVALDYHRDPDAMGPETAEQARAGTTEEMPASADGMPMAAKGGKVPVLLSPGERKLTPKAAQKVAKGANPIEESTVVPGKYTPGDTKDDYDKDTTKDAVEPGTVILPKSVTQAKHPEWAAHRFMVQLAAKGGKIPKKGK